MNKIDKRRKYFWHGEPVKTEFGFSLVKYNSEKPLYWYNYECWKYGAMVGLKHDFSGCIAIVDAIRVTLEDDESFIISNRFGIGAHKLKLGGWPNITHSTIPKDAEFRLATKHDFVFRKLDLEGYEKYEQERRSWQKKTFPKEYDKLEALRKGIRKSPIYNSKQPDN